MATEKKQKATSNKIKEQPLKLYTFLYNSCIWESAASTMSLHRTRKGAVAAMKKHKEEARKEYEARVERVKIDLANDKEIDDKSRKIIIKSYKFGQHEWWGTGTVEVED